MIDSVIYYLSFFDVETKKALYYVVTMFISVFIALFSAEHVKLKDRLKERMK